MRLVSRLIMMEMSIELDRLVEGHRMFVNTVVIGLSMASDGNSEWSRHTSVYHWNDQTLETHQQNGAQVHKAGSCQHTHAANLVL